MRRKPMELLRELNEITERKRILSELTLALEHQTYKTIPNTSNSFRQDSGNTNTKTEKHAHVYARKNGNGAELYSVNISGTGHDGSSGKEIPKTHADYFRSLGYKINMNNALESIDYYLISLEDFEYVVLKEDQ